MRSKLAAMTAAILAVTATAYPMDAKAQGTALSGGKLECPGSSPNSAAPGDTESKTGSCNLVFRNNPALVGASVADLLGTVQKSCAAFPNGPYQRHNETSGSFETNIDYVTLKIPSVNNQTPGKTFELQAATIDAQLGGVTNVSAEVGGQLAVLVSSDSSFTNSSATVTLTQTDPTIRSQIVSSPAFVLFEKNQGGGGSFGTLVCDLRMWFKETAAGAVNYGINDFVVQHRVNEITVGWPAGPSGMGSQTNAKDACAIAGNSIDAGGDPDVDPNLEKPVSYLVGSYKVTGANPASPVNLTGCGVDEDSGDPVVAQYCDPTELPGDGPGDLSRINACNPEGQSGGIPSADLSGVNGTASICYFSGRGTFMSFPC